jgi:hypothetical protein
MPTYVTLPTGCVAALEWRYDQPARLQAALREAHKADVRPTCECRRASGEQLEVVIRRFEPPEDRPGVERYHLARMPNTGQLHDPGCGFYAADPTKSGLGAYESGVVREEDDLFKVRLSHSLLVRTVDDETQDEAAAPRPRDRAPSASGRQRAMSPLGLLHLMWKVAELNSWRSEFTGRRDWASVAGRLSVAAQSIQVGRATLEDVLAIASPQDPERFKNDVWQQIHGCISRRAARHVVLIAEVVNVEGDGRLVLKRGWSPYGLAVFATEAQIVGLERSYPFAVSVLKDDSTAQSRTHVIGIFIFEAHAGKVRPEDGPTFRGPIIEAGLMTTSKAFLPVESSFELGVAERLVAEGRSFSKPLRYDAAAQVVFPDFELLDTAVAPLYPMEVFGRSDEAYSLRRREKEEYYTREYGTNWWSWIAAGDGRTGMPPFPPKGVFRRPASPRKG